MFSERDASPAIKQVEFHHIKPEYAGNSLSRALSKGLITEEDRSLIVQHVAWVAVTSNISTGRVNNSRSIS